MNTKSFMEYETYVNVDGEQLSLWSNPEIEFLDVEKDKTGKETITFKYKGKIKKSKGIRKCNFKLK
jgi:hypothetical protein